MQARRGHGAVQCDLLAVLALAGALLPSCGAPPGPAKRPTLAPVDGPSSALRESARLALDRYVRLHRAIMDPRDTSVEKKFLVLQPLLGMGNSQIEEVTALLIAMETKRALVIDLFDRSVGDSVAPERTPWFAPYSETYNRTIDLSKEQLARYAENGAQVGMLPERREHLYAQFNEFLACGNWNEELSDRIVGTPGRFLGYLAAYLNGQQALQGHRGTLLAHAGSAENGMSATPEALTPANRGQRGRKESKEKGRGVLESFGPFFFSLASEFLHAPSRGVKKRVAKAARASRVETAPCSVGMHIRWGAASDSFFYVDHSRPFQSLNKYLECAKSLCPTAPHEAESNATVWLLATDSEWVREEVVMAARFLNPRLVVWHSEAHVAPDNREHQMALTEMLVVGKAKHLVTTRLSTFSYAMHARTNKRPWLVSAGEATCRQLEHSQDGLFTTPQVHDRWPWQEAQIQRLSCADKINMSHFRLAPPLCSPLCPV